MVSKSMNLVQSKNLRRKSSSISDTVKVKKS